MAAITGALLNGCSSTKVPRPYQTEAFPSQTPFQYSSTREPEEACEVARRALLSQGYVVGTAQAEQVSGRKYFQPSPEHHVQLEFRVVCASKADDADAAVVFVSGLREQYIVRKIKESASLGVGGLGSLSLPVEGSMDSMVKVASETVTDAALYERFFELLGTYLDRVDVPGRRTPQAQSPERLS